MEDILHTLLKIFGGKNIVLVPCLYILLWFMKKTPLFHRIAWLPSCLLPVLGAVMSALLGGFDFFHILLGFAAGGIALMLYR